MKFLRKLLRAIDILPVHGFENFEALEDQIRDLERIRRTTNALYEIEKSPVRRVELAIELGDIEHRIDRLREELEACKHSG
jgi:chromosome segregation ATPase